MKVDLKDVIEAIEFENNLLTHYYNKKTGVIIYKEDESVSRLCANDYFELEKHQDWEQELIKELYNLEKNSDDYIQLPSVVDINERGMMIEFLEDHKVLVNDREARDLKKVIEDKGLVSEWYDFREVIEKEIAINWCEKNDIEYKN